MFKPQYKFKTFILCLAALFCVGLGLGAQDLKVAVLEPTGKEDVRSHLSLARNAFINTISRTNGFQVIDRARTDQILEEHSFQRNTGLLASSEARELGKILGVDFIFTSELSRHDDDNLEISCQALDIVTGEIVGSESVVLDSVTSRLISEKSQGVIESILKTVNRRASSILQGRTAAGRDGSPSAMLSGLDAEISRVIKNNRSNAKWNRNRNNYELEVDLAGVNISENRQFSTPVFKISGNVSIMLIDEGSGNGSNVELEVEEFTEMSRDLIRNKLRNQIQSKASRIIRDLLAGLDD